MREDADQPMRAIACAIGVMLTVACGDGAQPVDARRDVGPSPLKTFDGDRLWILLEAIGMANVVCGEYYDGDDATRAALQGKCGDREKRLIAFLRLNGMPTLEPEHLRDGYIAWFRAKNESVHACMKAVPVPPLDNIEKRRSCDPWEDATVNRKETTESLGIIFPKE